MGLRTLVTRQSLGEDLARLGLSAGDVMLVHASMRRLGWVCGGAPTVVQALLDVIGPAGTLVVPTQTPDNKDPSRWSHESVPEQWWPAIREHLPAYDPRVTPSAGMGALAECVRTWPGSLRSGHPQTSFAALGPRARDITDGHALESPLGERSPLARLEELDARVLLLGVGYDRCTTFHLAEYRLPAPEMSKNACVIGTPDGPQWMPYETVLLHAADFDTLGSDFESGTGSVNAGWVGAAPCRLFRVREAVRFATDWIPGNRTR